MEDGPHEIPIEDVLDLHPFRAAEVRDVALDYLMEARARGLRQVRLIHGRGIGVQRERIVRLWEPLVEAVVEHGARADDHLFGRLADEDDSAGPLSVIWGKSMVFTPSAPGWIPEEMIA